jgi:hypothetical protein
MLAAYSIRRYKSMKFDVDNITNLQEVVKEKDKRLRLEKRVTMEKWWTANTTTYGFEDNIETHQDTQKHTKIFWAEANGVEGEDSEDHESADEGDNDGHATEEEESDDDEISGEQSAPGPDQNASSDEEDESEGEDDEAGDEAIDTQIWRDVLPKEKLPAITYARTSCCHPAAPYAKYNLKGFRNGSDDDEEDDEDIPTDRRGWF